MYPTEILAIIGGCLHEISLTQGLMLGLFTAGLVGGATHCAAMCGPFVMAQSGDLRKMRDAALLPYHLGRITTYIGMAIALSSILNLAFLFLPIRSFIIAPILATAGMIFLISAFPALGRIAPWLGNIRISLPYRLIERGFQSLNREASAPKRYAMGVLLGFMPCGLIVSALMAAATAPSAWQAGLAMGAFGLGTIPALIGAAMGGNALKARYPIAMKTVTQGMMVWSGLWLFIMAGMILV